MHKIRHVRGRRPNRRRSAAKNATAKIAHIAITPQGENGVGDEKRRASIMSGGLVIQRPPTWTTTATTSASNVRAVHDRPTIPVSIRRSAAAERARDPVRQSLRIQPECRLGRAMRAAGSTLQRRSARKWRLQGRPRSGSPSPISFLCSQLGQAGCRTKCASRLVSFALRITGRRKTVLNSLLS